MLAAVPGNQAAIGQHYNVCSDRAVTFSGMRTSPLAQVRVPSGCCGSKVQYKECAA
jgi:hypothetical protein